MSEWWTYHLSDLLMFSAATYYRLFELYNLDVWPLHLLAGAIGVALLAGALRGAPASRMAAFLLGLCWAWVGWAFHARRYATINLAGGYFAVAFELEAALLWIAALRGALAFAPRTGGVRAGHALLLVALAGYPLLAPVAGRPWRQLELFGLAPDPTAVATLGVLLLAERAPWWLWPIPLLWCAVSSVTLSVMQTPGAWLALLLALSALLLHGVRAYRRART